jgi:hypothetical protein
MRGSQIGCHFYFDRVAVFGRCSASSIKLLKTVRQQLAELAIWETRKPTGGSNGSKPDVRAIGARTFELALTS